MAYYVRLFSKTRIRVPLASLQSAENVRGLEFVVETGTAESWDQLLVRKPNGPNLCLIDRDERGIDSIVEEEIEEFVRFLDGEQPQAGAAWVCHYLAQCNEEGYSAVLKFSETATGPWSVALLNADGSWQTGRIELGNSEHRAGFREGRLPAE